MDTPDVRINESDPFEATLIPERGSIEHEPDGAAAAYEETAERRKRRIERRAKAEKMKVLIIRLHTQGYSTREIAKKLTDDGLKCNKTYTHKVIQRMYNVLHDEQKKSLEYHISNLIAENRTVRKEAWEAWERSKREKKRSSVRKRGGVSELTGEPYTSMTDSKIEKIEGHGDVRFLATIQEGLAEEARILNIYSDAGDAAKKNPNQMTSDERQQEIIKILMDVELGSNQFVTDLKAGAFSGAAESGESGTGQRALP